jgi:glycosyltransferase involved in cell wall biosynthesis
MPHISDPAASVWFVIPAFNEAAVIEGVVSSVRHHCPHLVLVDDGSRDETGMLASRAGALVVTHPINLGQGAALQTGIDYARACAARFIVTFDADGQHEAAEVQGMLDRLTEGAYDIVLGSRFLGNAENLPPLRRLLLRLGVLFTRMTTGLELTDTHNGLRVMTAEAAGRLRIRHNGMAHASEILEQVASNRMRYAEAPVRVHYSPYSLAKGQRLSGSVRILSDLMLDWFSRR